MEAGTERDDDDDDETREREKQRTRHTKIDKESKGEYNEENDRKETKSIIMKNKTDKKKWQKKKIIPLYKNMHARERKPKDKIYTTKIFN